MPDKGPLDYSSYEYAWVLILAIWGGIASYIQKVRNGTQRYINVAELIGDIVISGFSGIMAFYLCESLKLPQIQCAIIIGVSGHMGSRFIFLAEKCINNKINALFHGNNGSH